MHFAHLFTMNGQVRVWMILKYCHRLPWLFSTESRPATERCVTIAAYNRSSIIVDRWLRVHLGRCWKVQRAEGKARSDVTARNEVKPMLKPPRSLRRVQPGAGCEETRSWKNFEVSPRRGSQIASSRGYPDLPRLRGSDPLDRRFPLSLDLEIANARMWDFQSGALIIRWSLVRDWILPLFKN